MACVLRIQTFCTVLYGTDLLAGTYTLVHLATKVGLSPFYADFHRHFWLCKDVQ